MVIDNLKAGVIQADWFDPQLNPKLGFANVGPNPTLTNTVARTNAATLVTSFRTWRNDC